MGRSQELHLSHPYSAGFPPWLGLVDVLAEGQYAKPQGSPPLIMPAVGRTLQVGQPKRP